MLFQHPTSGVQFPAGTVEDGEQPADAARREVGEETGVLQTRLVAEIGALIEAQPECVYIVKSSKIYARPDITSFDWATLRKGLQVRMLRLEGEFAQVSYEETDRYPDPQYITYQITGWLPQDCLAGQIRRRLFHLAAEQETPPAWEHFADQHLFRPFWARLDNLCGEVNRLRWSEPPIVWPQCDWWRYVTQELGYDFTHSHTE